MQEINDNVFQDTIPEDIELENQDVNTIEEEAVTPNGEFQDNEGITRDADLPLAQNTASEKSAANSPFITVQYNHKNRDFTKDEAIQFIQKGMHTESLRAKLEYIAKAQNTDVNSLVEKIISAPEQKHRAQLEDMYGVGSKEVELGMKIYREKQSNEYKAIMNEIDSVKQNNNVNSRLANEYLSLKQQIPDAPDYSDLPDTVIIEAATGKRDLLSAYLCHQYNEQKKIDAAKKSQEAAQSASLGKMNNFEGDGMSSSERNFLVGLWSK